MNEQPEDTPEKSRQRQADASSSNLPDTLAHTRPLHDDADAPRQASKKMANVRMVRSDELFQGKRELWITHGDEVYRLIVTRHKKLILQK